MNSSAQSYADLAGPPFLVREPTCTPEYEFQRELYGLIGAHAEGYPDDFLAPLAINILVAAMLSEAARRSFPAQERRYDTGRNGNIDSPIV